MSANRVRLLNEQIERDRETLDEIDRLMRLPVYDLPGARNREKLDKEGTKVLNRIWALRKKIAIEQGDLLAFDQVPEPIMPAGRVAPRRSFKNPKIQVPQ